MDIHALARRLNNVEYLASVDEPAHHELSLQLRDLGGTPLSSNLPYSFKRNYEELLKRQQRWKPPTEVPSGPPPFEALRVTAQRVRDMRVYLNNVLHQHGYGAEILGLSADDLTTVAVDSDGLVQLAGRITPIHDRLRQLTNDQIRVFFLECRVQLLETRLADLE